LVRIEQSVTQLTANFVLKLSINYNSSAMKTKVLFMACLLAGIGLTQLSAQKRTYVDNWEVNLGFWIPCTSEWVEGTVTVHSVFSYTYIPDWDVYVDLFSHQNPLHGELICAETGNIYKIVGGVTLNQRSYFNPGGAGIIWIQNLHLKGNGVNFITHVTWTTVIKPDGELVHDYYIENIQCN